MKGIFIPQEIIDDYDLNIAERVVLAIYRYYTVEGGQHCCSLKNDDICRMIGSNERTLQRIKKHLKELGYIRTDGGIRVYYLGKKGDTGVTPGATKMTPGGDKNDTPGATKIAQKGDTGVAHNKEEKRKKELKKEMKEKQTNLDLLLDRLPDDYKTPETIEYIKNNYLDRINKMDFRDNGVIDSCLVVLKSELLKKFTIYPVINKPVPERKTEDDLMW